MIVKGKVLKGEQKATKLGFPTANIEINVDLEPGIYAGKAVVEGVTHNASIYIPSKNPHLLEAHILDFDCDLYEKEIEVHILNRLRKEVRATDDQKLREMILNDVEMTRLSIGNLSK
ncbi:MAG: riboflavin kinase / adenylyltransferase [Patescibacteria group bacterium]|nr:riboflavin kinase / adenylyltransferase [Patescibacteria group bacterium]